MTAQASDSVWYRDREFSITGVNGTGLYEPSQHDIEPFGISTACWRGFICDYALDDDQLVLRTLFVGLDKAASERARTGHGTTIAGVLPEWAEYFGWKYTPLNVPVSFTGGLLIGDGFITELYVHMGFHPAWKFSHVYELMFEAGRLRASHDRSQQMAEFRAQMTDSDLQPPAGASKEEIHQWVEQTFSLDYSL